MSKVGIIDIGVGNLRSVYHAINEVGADVLVSSNKRALNSCHKLVFPGVGAYGNVMAKLQSLDLQNFLTDRAENGGAILGICVGMQVMGVSGVEFGEHAGLGLVNNVAVPLSNFSKSKLRLPHVGWQTLSINETTRNDHGLFKDISSDDRYYFIHGFALAHDRGGIIASSCYGDAVFASVVRYQNVFGVQFHPEKSREPGLKILKNFIGDK